MIRIIIFDFDGVILESNNVKADAFVQLFKGHPQHIKESIRRFHLQNGGMPRFDKIRRIYADILNMALTDEKFKELCDDFGKIVFDGVCCAPMVNGIEDFLKKNKSKYDMYIVSGTPQDEIRRIVNKRGLNEYFLGVYGSPDSKKDIILRLLKNNNYSPEETVYLGDSINDYKGASEANIEFVAKVSKGFEQELFPGVMLKTKVNTIMDFEKYLINKNGD